MKAIFHNMSYDSNIKLLTSINSLYVKENKDYKLTTHIRFMRVGAMRSCFDVASYFIWLANETGSFISNLKLQKLVYYAQAWHLAIHNTPLFEKDFQAWVHGLVIPDLYQKYKHFGWQPILEEANPAIPKEIQDFLDEVTQEYFSCDAYELEQMTHAEDPWNRARENLPSDAPSNAIIQKEWMKEYYSKRVEEKASALPCKVEYLMSSSTGFGFVTDWLDKRSLFVSD